MPHRNIFRRILFCTDFSVHADAAFSYALNIAEGNPGSELIIFHVVPEPNAQFWKSYIYEVDRIDEKAKHDIDERISRSYLSRIPQAVSWSTLHAVGNVSQKILETTEEREVDLVIIGREGRGRLKTLFFGNIAEQLARKTRTPVLIVPEPDGDRKISGR